MRSFHRRRNCLTFALLLTSASAWSSFFALGKVSAESHPLAKSESSLNELSKVQEEFGVKPTDAKHDSVWHNVPGLSGWMLNVPATEAATRQARDQKLHLVWNSALPKVSLKMLPADSIYRGSPGEKSVTLMINVSWGEEYLPKMLETLHKENVRATFFLDGAWVKSHLQMARHIVEEGQDVGSHGTGHPDFKTLTEDRLARQLDVTNTILNTRLGIQCSLIAPPSGSYDGRLVRLATDRHMHVILWTADTIDWKKPQPDVILARVRNHLTPGALILMHPTRSTAEALPQLIRMVRDKGYTLKTVSDVVEEKPSVKPPETLALHPGGLK
ncbi:MAG: polysaccharide deacetylase family protein [Alicyclobacillaceae bacterium]|nr:polysaccharide deacetylase family protein [Alicyclobacillaceae bacterium]